MGLHRPKLNQLKTAGTIDRPRVLHSPGEIIGTIVTESSKKR